MSAIFSDIWAYLCLAGIVVGAVLFRYVLRNYRQASDTDTDLLPEPEEDSPEDFSESGSDPVSEQVVDPVAEAAEQAGEEPVSGPPEEEPLKTLKTGETVRGGVSPAVTFLQNLKLQMEHFETEIHQLRSEVVSFAQRHDQEFDILLKKMSEMHQKLHDQLHKSVVPAPAANEPSPISEVSAQQIEPQLKVIDAPAPVLQATKLTVKAPAPEPKPEAIPSESTMTIELPTAAAETTVPVVETIPAAVEQAVAPDAKTEEQDLAEKTAQDVADTLKLSDPIKVDRNQGSVWPV